MSEPKKTAKELTPEEQMELRSLSDFSYDRIDGLRTTGCGWSAIVMLEDGRVEEVQTKEFQDRLRCNSIIDPIVSDLRKVHGKPHKVGDVIKNFEVEDGVFEGGKLANKVLDAEGEFRLVPEGDRNIISKCGNLAHALLMRKFTEIGLNSKEQVHQIIQEILGNRFYEHVEVGANLNLERLCALITREAVFGYNTVVLQQENINKKKEE
ncbi:predicted protein [Chaetoceros tenuissimus]|uniref:Uncharacterized protein n=1 Tax=Chaetoceros tenuissimus TaxID=426638 RepID=A0AAD3D0D0_9STRA|nr:predicted protein [Chaetoceros tenuissimus]